MNYTSNLLISPTLDEPMQGVKQQRTSARIVTIGNVTSTTIQTPSDKRPYQFWQGGTV